jgi:hypothetical protein
MKALEGTTPWRFCGKLSDSNDWAVRFMHHKGLGLCYRITLTENRLSWKANSMPVPYD